MSTLRETAGLMTDIVQKARETGVPVIQWCYFFVNRKGPGRAMSVVY
jgi:hypothetical protein